MKTESEANVHEALFTHSLILDRETMQTVPCGESGEMEYATAKPFPLGDMKGRHHECEVRSRKATV